MKHSENTQFDMRLAVILVVCLFFMWGFALNLNPILIPHLKKACRLSDFQSALIDSASYVAYFIFAIPAGKVMRRYGYKGGILVGLILFALGSFLFYPAAETRMYGFFLGALFIIAAGLTFLETAANPYIMVLGDSSSEAARLNFAQSFNGLAATVAPLVGGVFILSGKMLTPEQEAGMTPEQLNGYLDAEASSVQVPFLIIGGVVLFVAILLWRTHLPEIGDESKDGKGTRSLLKEKKLMLGVVAQFFYVGAQVCISSFFIRFAYQVGGIEEKAAAFLLSLALFAFMAGRFFGTFLMRFVSPARMLLTYTIANFILLITAVSIDGKPSVYALVAVQFFLSIMFPTIFALSLRGLGANTKEGSSLVIMSIVGGAIFPAIMGKVSDLTSIQTAYLVPAACLIVVFYFALKNSRAEGVLVNSFH